MKIEERGTIMELLEKQFLEAKNVLEILVKKYKIDKKIFDDFEENKTIYITEDTKLYEINNNKEILKIAENIEKKEKILIYHCILENKDLVRFLYISSNESTWENDEALLYLNGFKVKEVNLNNVDSYIEKNVNIISANNRLKVTLDYTEDELININLLARTNIKILKEYPNLLDYSTTYKKKLKDYLEEIKKLQIDFNDIEKIFFNDSEEMKSVMKILNEKRYYSIFEKYIEEIKREDENGAPENYFIFKDFSIETNVIKDNFSLINEGIATIIESIEKGNLRIELKYLIANIGDLLTRIRKVYEIYSIYLVKEGKADIYKKNINVFIRYEDILQKTNKTLKNIKKEKKYLFL